MKNRLFHITSLLALLVSGFTLGACQKDNKIHIALGMWPNKQQTKDVAMFQKWKMNFEKDHPEYVIEASPYTYDPGTIAANALSNTLPTVFQTYFTEPPKLIKNKYIREVTDIVKEVKYYDSMNVFMRKTLEDENGKLYGVPRDGYGFGVLLNLKTLNYYGLVEGDAEKHEYKLYDENNKPLYPTTYEELKNWAIKISEESSGEVRGTMIYSASRNGGWLLSNLAWSFGAELEKMDTNGNYYPTLDDEGVIDALLWIQELKQNGALPDSLSITYNDWYSSITSKIAMAFCGNDVIANAVSQGQVDKNDLAFIPMPKGPSGLQYSLYGGTPFVFSNSASDEQVKGALLFLEYMGRSPIVSEVEKQAMRDGKETSKLKNDPILPSIYPWTNEDFIAYTKELEDEYVNINRAYFDDFYNTIEQYKHAEVPKYAQEMYEILDEAVQNSLKDPTRDRETILNQLTTLNERFKKNF